MSKRPPKGHRFNRSYSTNYPGGRCECGWRYLNWTERITDIWHAHARHCAEVRAEKAKLGEPTNG